MKHSTWRGKIRRMFDHDISGKSARNLKQKNNNECHISQNIFVVNMNTSDRRRTLYRKNEHINLVKKRYSLLFFGFESRAVSP